MLFRSLELESRLVKLLLESQSLFESAHDLSNGGLAASLTESVLAKQIGAEIKLNEAALNLFSETPGRVLITVDPKNSKPIHDLADKYQIEITTLGKTGGTALKINEIDISLQELSDAFTQTFPKLFG